VGEHAEFTAPDGGIVAVLQPVGRWPWVMLLLGMAIIVLGGILLSHDASADPTGTMQPSVTQQAVP